MTRAKGEPANGPQNGRKVLQAMCARCGGRMSHPRPNKRFCGSTCRVYALRDRRRGGLTAAAVGP